MEEYSERIRTGMAQGMEAFIASMEEYYVSLWPGYKRRLVTADLEAFLAMAQDRPNLAEVLPTMPMPCCLYAGEQDGAYPAAKECSQQIPNVTFFSLPGLNHPEAFMRSELILPHVTKFLATVAH